MIPLCPILQDQADYVRRSRISVTITRGFETVAIDAPGCSGVFMQEHEAAEFIATIDALAEQYPDTDSETIELIAAYPYADSLE